MIYQLALFGHPVSHSLSPQIQQGFARQFGLDINYKLIDVTAEKLHTRVQEFFTQGGHGANVTVPHKQAVMTTVDQLTERAQQAQAVNTLYLKNNQIWGDNTDGIGLIKDLEQKNITLTHKRILILGTGGAVQGILPNLLQTHPQSIHLSNRTSEKAEKLARLSPLCHILDGSQTTTGFDLIINGTSLGHQGKSPPLYSHWFHANTISYDLSYGLAASPFLTAIKNLSGTKAFDGLGMLYHQAAFAFEMWFNQNPAVVLP